MENSYGRTADRFLKYVQVGTSSAEDMEQVPSTPEQLEFAKIEYAVCDFGEIEEGEI